MAKKSLVHSVTGRCLSCVHYGYCLIYWGAECKRQGGKKIPRVKSTQWVDINSAQLNISVVNIQKFTKKIKRDKSINAYPKNKVFNSGDRIRTRAFNW